MLYDSRKRSETERAIRAFSGPANSSLRNILRTMVNPTWEGYPDVQRVGLTYMVNMRVTLTDQGRLKLEAIERTLGDYRKA